MNTTSEPNKGLSCTRVARNDKVNTEFAKSRSHITYYQDWASRFQQASGFPQTSQDRRDIQDNKKRELYGIGKAGQARQG